MNALMKTSKSTIRFLDQSGPWLALLLLRILIGWEFLEAGLEKFHGENWFAEIHSQFPFPFNIVPTAISWQIATWFEIIGGAAIIVGIGTRFFSFSLIILTVVAILAVHWPAEWNSFAELMQGYVISNQGYGNFKLPVLFLAMLIPLVFMGPGKLSIDAFIRRQYMG
jgi:putative oxidoreductase